MGGAALVQAAGAEAHITLGHFLRQVPDGHTSLSSLIFATDGCFIVWGFGVQVNLKLDMYGFSVVCRFTARDSTLHNMSVRDW